jgi:hypothetical protein
MNTKKPLTPAELDRRHHLQVLIGGLAYAAVLIGSIALLKRGASGWVRIALAISPMVPAAFVIWSVFRQVTRMDELQRRIHTEAFAIAAAGTAFLGLTYTFLEGSVGFPPVGSWWAWVSVAMIYALARAWLSRRYQ